MKKRLTGWQAVELAHKYYLIAIGTFMIIVAVFTAFTMENSFIGAFLLGGIGALSLFLGIISKIKGIE